MSRNPVGCSMRTRSPPAGRRAIAPPTPPSIRSPAATLAAPRTPIEVWQRTGMKVRVMTAPPSNGGASRLSLGTVVPSTSPSPISFPASSRMSRSRSARARSASRSAGVSYPVTPSEDAAISTVGMPLSTQVTGTSATRSSARPVGNNGLPLCGNSMVTGAAAPGTPEISAEPV